MNSHYTGYELELNQSRQASIRSHFEQQAQAKALNEGQTVQSPSRIESTGPSKLRKFGIISLLGSILVLAYFVLVPFTHAAALFNTSESTFYNTYYASSAFTKQTGAFSPVEVAAQTLSAPSLAGKYTVRVLAKDIPALLRFEEPAVNKFRGNWEISLDDRGTFTASLNNVVMLKGQFEVSSDQVTFSSDVGTTLCSNDPEEIIGTYSWSQSEQGMSLDIISDKCYLRSLVLSTHLLNQVKPVQDYPRGRKGIY